MFYPNLRPKIQTGDAILWKGTTIASRLIRLFTEYSHASLVVRLDQYYGLQDRVFLVEALGGGLKLRLLSDRVRSHPNEAYYLGITATDEQREQVLNFAVLECARGVKYDYRSLIKNILGRVNVDADRYFCSEFVWQAWLEGGIVKPTIKAPRPGDLPEWVSGRLGKIEFLA